MSTLYLTEDYATVRRDSEDCLLIQIPERKDHGNVTAPAQKRRIPLIKVDDVVVLGEVTMTSSAIHMLLEKNIEIHFLNYSGSFKGRLTPGLAKNSLLRLAQHRAHAQFSQRYELARRFVVGKISNQRTLLQRAQRRHPDAELEKNIDCIARVISQLSCSTDLSENTITPTLVNGDAGIHGTPLETVLGMEGQASAAYFSCFGKLIADPHTWPFPGRVKRPPTDAVNALLSYGYSLLTSKVSSMLHIVGFDPFIGYLHSSTYGRPALALDLMEEFRPLIVDSVVITMLNNRMLTPANFHVELGAYRLEKEPRKLFLKQFEDRLNEEITHPVFGYKAKYRYCIELQARLLAKYLTGEIKTYTPLITR